jgi:hypothetical protein
MLFTGCTALNTVTKNNKKKVVSISSETWGGKIVAEMVSIGESFLPNITICFGKTSTYYNATPIETPYQLINSLADHVESARTIVSVNATGMSERQKETTAASEVKK